MKPEKQTSFETDVDQALAIVADSGESSNVIQFPTERVSSDGQSHDNGNQAQSIGSEPTTVEQTDSSNERNLKFVPTAALLTATALTALAIAPRGGDAPAPQPESFTDKVQESAQTPYDPSKDELVIDGIRIKPGNALRNTPSEAVLSDREVKAYIDRHPEESSSLTSSAMVLPTNETGEYVVVKRDVDKDGDRDSVAVSTEE
jgi:hypothetical protein